MIFSKKSIDKLSQAGAYLSALGLVGLVLLIVTEIFLRYFFNLSTLIADEYSGYIYLAIVFLGLGFTLSSDSHLRVNILTANLSKKTHTFIDRLCAGISILTLLFILHRVILLVIDSYSFNMRSENVSHTPIYLTQIAMPIGIALFIIALIGFSVFREKK